MSVTTRIGSALTRIGNRLQGTPAVERTSGGKRPGPYMPRDQVLGASPIAPASRQVWELYRAREESRNLSLNSPYLRAFLAWAKVHAVGTGRSHLQFPRIGPDERIRLEDPLAWLRDRWAEFQGQEIGARGETLPRLGAHALWHRLVDGDCFLIRYAAAGGLRYQFYDGEALSEEQYLQWGSRARRALGITYDRRGRAETYHFGYGGSYRPLEYSGWQASGVDVVDVPARYVLHVRSRNEDGVQLRSWPWATASIDWLNRVHDFYFAFVRSMIRRASFGLYLEPDPERAGADTTLLDGMEPVDEEQAEDDARQMGRVYRRLAYQVARDEAGESVVADPGYKLANPFLPAASPQEAELVHRLELAVGAGLRCSIPTMLGDYKGANFSGSQQGTLQERETIGDLQWELGHNVYEPIYADWLAGLWPEMLMRFPRLMPEDRPLLTAEHKLRKPPVLEKHRIIPAVLRAFWEGAMTLEEMRSELGLPTADLPGIVAQIRADHEMMEDMKPGGGGGAPPAGGDGEPPDPEERDEEQREDKGE